MKRIMLLVTAVLVTAAMMLAMAMPAFAAQRCTFNGSVVCHGGFGEGVPEGGGGSGSGGTLIQDSETGEYVVTGGGGFGGTVFEGGGGSGGRCTGNLFTGESDCTPGV
jgi:hypothetical protein